MKPQFESMMQAAQESQGAEKERRDKARDELIEKKVREVFELRENQVKLNELVKESGIQTNEMDDFMLESNLEAEHLMKKPEVEEMIQKDALEEKEKIEEKIGERLDRYEQYKDELKDEWLGYEIKKLESYYSRAKNEDKPRIVGIIAGRGVHGAYGGIRNIFQDKEYAKRMFGDLTEGEVLDGYRMSQIIDRCKRMCEASVDEENKEKLLAIIKEFAENENYNERVIKHAEKALEELIGGDKGKEIREAD